MSLWLAIGARHWPVFAVGVLAGICSFVVVTSMGASLSHSFLAAVVGTGAGMAVAAVIRMSFRDVFVPMWQDRHLRGYGFKTREQRAFLSIFRDQLRMGLVPGSVLDEASCVTGAEMGFETMHLVDIGQAARYLRGSRVADKFAVDELVLIFHALPGCDFDEKNIVELLAYTDDAAAISQYLIATRDAGAALDAMVAGIAPEYASAI